MDLLNEFKKEYSSSGALDISLPESITQSYVLEACLKDGKERSTYLLRDRFTGQKAVLKLSQGGVENLMDEYVILASLDNAALPRALHYFELDGKSYLIRQYLEGETLDEYVQKRNGLDEREVIDISKQLCDVLIYLHGQNPPVIHRDIKAQNIIYTPDKRCRLIDFGISRRFDAMAGKDTIVLGTCATAAPEQFGYRQTDMRSDIYSLGVLMGYILTDEFGSDAVTASNASAGLKKIIARCTRFDPADRYQSMAALCGALKRLKTKRITRWLSAGAFAATAAIILICAIKTPIAPANAAIINADIPAYKDGMRIYTFKSPELQAEVCRQLGKDADSITYADLDTITEIMLCADTNLPAWGALQCFGRSVQINGDECRRYGTICTLEDISAMKNLDTLVLCNQQIVDISPLRGSAIRYLALSCNKISNLEPLAECAELREVCIGGNPINDVSALSSAQNLYGVDIGATDVENIGPLAGLDIEWLGLYECEKLRDVLALSRIPTLRRLGMNNANEDMLKTICTLDTVDTLIMFNSGIEDVSVFAGMSSLKELNVFSNNVTNLDSIKYLSSLERLDVGANPLTDISPLTVLTGLKQLNIERLKIEDYSPFLELKELERVFCTKLQMTELKQALGEVPFEVLEIG